MTLRELEAAVLNYKSLLLNDVYFVIPESELGNKDYTKRLTVESFEVNTRETGSLLVNGQVYTIEELDKENLWDLIYNKFWDYFFPKYNIDDGVRILVYNKELREWLDCHLDLLPRTLYTQIEKAVLFYVQRCIFYKDGLFYKGIKTQTHFDLLIKFLDAVVDCYKLETGLLDGKIYSEIICENVETGNLDTEKAYKILIDMELDLNQQMICNKIEGKKPDWGTIAFLEFLPPIQTYLTKWRPVAKLPVGKDVKCTLKELALICFYKNFRIDDNNKNEVAASCGHVSKTSGNQLYNRLHEYKNKENRHGLTESKRIDTAHRNRLLRVLELLEDGSHSLRVANAEFQIFHNQYIVQYQIKT